MNVAELDPSDGDLPAGHGALDSAAALYRRYSHGLFAYARALTHDPSISEDIMQEAFVRLLRCEQRKSVRSVRSFLFGVVRKLGMEFVRKASIQRRHHPALAGSKAGCSPQDKERNAHLSTIALAALEELPDDQREAVVLKVFSGMTFAQIGELTGIPAATAASRYRYGVEKLTERLAAPGGVS